MKFFRGTAVYIASIIQSLIEYKSMDMEVHFDGKVRFGKAYLVAVGNGATVAGGVQLMPGAKINDALFQVCHIEDIHVGTIMKHFPKLFNGRIGEVRQVTLEKSSYLRIEKEEPIPVHMDGEVLSVQEKSLEVEMQPATLHVISGDIKQQ
jgi:diacylglycerol kinase family enzyme